MYCANCGEEISDRNQKFCENCGSKLEFTQQQHNQPSQLSSQTKSSKGPVTDGLGLFDLKRNYYVLKEKYWDWGSGDILDENGHIIGRMNRIIFSIRRRIELMENDGSIAATIHEKIVSARGAQDLKDSQGNLIARIKKKITSFFRPKFWLESPDGRRWYEAQGEFMGWSYKIKDLSTGNIVAEIEKADRWRDVFLGGLFDFQDTYALKILDNETDRRILVGFVLSIDNVLHDNRHGGFMHTHWGPGPLGRRRPGRFPGPGRWP
ncbi:MAG: zinc-ribbon domain-containing protein [Candidatus Lokiarchaeota archaeon]|nr:zinc-ribbon domain-containing protein [Candidatus Lokiarchaeota archaeon]